MTGIKCLDSSTWLSYYFGEHREARTIIEGEALIITSALSLFEIKKRLLILKKDWRALVGFVKQRSQIIPVSIAIVEQGADLAFEKKLGAVDALIYTTAAIHHAELLTGDNDFRGLENVTILPAR